MKPDFKSISNPKIKTVLLIILSVFFFSSSSWAATYYVDKTAGKDSNPGTQNQPWEHCPGMVGWSGNASLKAGDAVYFDNRDTWTGGGGNSLVEVVGGVRYDGSTWGSGTRATMKATGSFSRSIMNIRDDHSTFETVITGFNIDGNGQATSGANINWPSSTNLTGATKKIANCTIHDITQGSSAVYGIKVGAIGGDEVWNVEIIDNLIYNTPRTGLNLYLAIECPSCIARNTVVRGNEVYNTGGVGAGHGIMLKNYSINTLVEFNYVHNTSAHGISLENQGAPGPKNAVIRYNIVRDCGKGGVNIMNSGDKSVDVYGNLIYQNNRAGILFQNVNGANISAKFYNNVLYHNARNSDNVEFLITTATYKSLEVINNIIAPISGKSAFSGGSMITSQSNNLVGNVNFKNTNNLPTGFKGTYGKDMEPNADGFSVVSGVAIDGGATLSSPYDGAINTAGKSGGLSRSSFANAWDVGAYEFISAPKPPTNLRIIE